MVDTRTRGSVGGGRPGPLSAFEAVEERLARYGGDDVVALHQGKTWFAPCATPREWDRSELELLANEHAPVGGARSLRRQAAEHLERHGLRAADPQDVVVCAGATHGLALALRTVLEPGDEVLVLSPQWLFAVGLVEAARGVPVEVPVFLELADDPGFDLVAAVERRITGRTKAIYFNSPNNPTGVSLDPAGHQALADLAERRDVWLIADNAYENYDYSPHGFIDVGRFPAAAHRTFSVYTCSKTYAMPGQRVGFVVAPAALAHQVRRWSLYSVYAVATASQFAAHQALAVAPDVLAARRDQARQSRDLVAAGLEVPHTRVDGGLYTLLDLRGWPGGDAHDFLDGCIRAGVSLAPGEAFGRHCRDHLRLCFTAVDPGRLEDAVQRVNRVHREGAR